MVGKIGTIAGVVSIFAVFGAEMGWGGTRMGKIREGCQGAELRVWIRE
jgi:hypothetical protein